jgi:hypothetical protein
MKNLLIGLLALGTLSAYADITNPKDSAKLALQIKKNLPAIVKLAKSRGWSFSINPAEMSVNCLGTESFYYDQLVGTCVVDDEMSLWTITISDSETGPKYKFIQITTER